MGNLVVTRADVGNPRRKKLRGGRRDVRVEVVGVCLSFCENLVERRPEERALRCRSCVPQPQSDGDLPPRRHGEPIIGGHLGADLLRIHGPLLALDDVVADAVLDEWRAVDAAVDAGLVGLVLGEQQLRFTFTVENV